MDYVVRETGAFPLSIGTSLALEGILQRHPNQARMPPGYKRVRGVWVNLRTLVRNFYASLTTAQQKEITVEQAIELLIEECRTIPTVLSHETKNSLSVMLYVTDFSETKWLYPNAKYWEPNTEKQRFRHNLEHFTLIALIEHLDAEGISYTVVKKRPPTTSGVVALLTHYPHELLWRFQFDGLFLLESHTGKLKSYTQWRTKLKGVKDEDHIPFNDFTLQLFGDGTLFDAYPKKLRDEVRQLADIRNWTGVTTLEKIQSDVRRYGGENLKRTLGELTSRV